MFSMVETVVLSFYYCVEGTDVPSILLNRMAEALSGTQPEPYADTLAKFDWEKVRFASYSAEDCKRIWSNISRQVCYSIKSNYGRPME